MGLGFMNEPSGRTTRSDYPITVPWLAGVEDKGVAVNLVCGMVRDFVANALTRRLWYSFVSCYVCKSASCRVLTMDDGNVSLLLSVVCV